MESPVDFAIHLLLGLILAPRPACPQRQATSGVFSIATHSVLQYLLPGAAWHVQEGRALRLLLSEPPGTP